MQIPAKSQQFLESIRTLRADTAELGTILILFPLLCDIFVYVREVQTHKASALRENMLIILLLCESALLKKV